MHGYLNEQSLCFQGREDKNWLFSLVKPILYRFTDNMIGYAGLALCIRLRNVLTRKMQSNVQP